MQLLSYIGSHPWAMKESDFQALLCSAFRVERDGLLARYLSGEMPSQPLPQTVPQQALPSGAGEEGEEAPKPSTLIIPIKGVIVQQDTMLNRFMASVFGGTITEVLVAQVQAALSDPSVERIVFDVNSPGGEAPGLAQASQAIYDARGQKETISYISGLACSAGYYFASSPERVYGAREAMVGSIGTIWEITNYDKMLERVGIETTDVVSKQSPYKNPDARKKEGRKYYQAVADSYADIFITDVARNMGVSKETVETKFGRGWVKIGQEALDAGMIHGLGSLRECMTADWESLTDATSETTDEAAQGAINMTASERIKALFSPNVDEAERDENAEELHSQLTALQGENGTLKSQVTALQAKITEFEAQQSQAAEAVQAEAAAKLEADADAFVTSLRSKIEPAKLEAHDFKADYLAAANAGTLGTLTAAFDALPVNPLLANSAGVKLHAVENPAPDQGVSEERKAELLNATPLGQSVVNKAA